EDPFFPFPETRRNPPPPIAGTGPRVRACVRACVRVCVCHGKAEDEAEAAGEGKGEAGNAVQLPVLQPREVRDREAVGKTGWGAQRRVWGCSVSRPKGNKSAGIGEIKCRVCQITWQTNITPLSHAIDVYSDWIDACEENNRGGAGPPPPAGNAGREIYVDPSSARGYEFEVEQNDRLPTHARVEGEGEEETEEVDEDRERYRWLDANPRSPAPPRH
ncbi:MAG: hypothetical protein BJ554DRAFT_6137, partial [Olpidium bornovanus]